VAGLSPVHQAVRQVLLNGAPTSRALEATVMWVGEKDAHLVRCRRRGGRMEWSQRLAAESQDRHMPSLASVDRRDPEPTDPAAVLGTRAAVSDVLAISATVSVIIPTLNEAQNLPHVFAALPDWISEVVIVDGRSTDDSVAVARQLRPDVKVVMQTGAGKGNALLAGFAASTGDIIVAMDADGSTDGREIVRFVAALTAGADFVKGSRFACGGGSEDLTAARRLGNKFLGALVNALFGTRYTDLCYGYNAFWARHLEILALDCSGFEVETLMNIRAAIAGLCVHEVPSFEYRRVYGASNLRIVLDGWRIAKVIVREWRTYRRSSSLGPVAEPAVRLSLTELVPARRTIRLGSDLEPAMPPEGAA
jgi:glycosyltransferase involved in cell wall biosynthesis